MILCNKCYKPLTVKELSKYNILEKHSSDMYCDKCEKNQLKKIVKNKGQL